MLDRLSVALDQLPPKLRVLVVLKDVYGLSHEEIADELGISVSAAKVRLHRGRKKLRDLLYDEASIRQWYADAAGSADERHGERSAALDRHRRRQGWAQPLGGEEDLRREARARGLLFPGRSAGGRRSR